MMEIESAGFCEQLDEGFYLCPHCQHKQSAVMVTSQNIDVVMTCESCGKKFTKHFWDKDVDRKENNERD